MHRLCHILLFLLPMISVGQNLVPNGSFEEYTWCPNMFQGSGWAIDWVVPAQGATPDYYNVCSSIPSSQVPQSVAGYQVPLTGDAYIGFFAFDFGPWSGREAITCQLLAPLEAGKKFVFNAYFSLEDSVLYAVRTLGFLLSESPLNGPEQLYEYVPTYFNQGELLDDKENWVGLNDTVTALGGEQYLTISNFLPNSQCDTVFVGNGNLMRDYAYYFIDDVSLIPLDSLLSIGNRDDFSFSIYPNPATTNLTIESRTPLAQVWVRDVAGRALRYTTLPRGTQDDRVVVDVSSLPSGIYLVEVLTQNGQRSVQKVVVE